MGGESINPAHRAPASARCPLPERGGGERTLHQGPALDGNQTPDPSAWADAPAPGTPARATGIYPPFPGGRARGRARSHPSGQTAGSGGSSSQGCSYMKAHHRRWKPRRRPIAQWSGRGTASRAAGASEMGAGGPRGRTGRGWSFLRAGCGQALEAAAETKRSFLVPGGREGAESGSQSPPALTRPAPPPPPPAPRPEPEPERPVGRARC